VWRDRDTAQITARVRAAASGRWGAPRALGRDSELYVPAAVAVDTHGNADVVWVGEEPGVMRSVQASRYSTSTGRWSSPVAISSLAVSGGERPSLVVDADGSATASWVSYDGSGGNRLHAAYRPAGRAWLAPVEVVRAPAETFITDFDLAAGGNATTLLTWSVYSGYWAEPVGTKPNPISIHAALGRDGNWQATTTLATVREGGGQPAAAVGAGGLAAVGWLGAEHGNAIVRVSIRQVGVPAWGPEAKVSFEDGQAEPPQLGIDGRGNVTAVWKVARVDVESSTLPAGSDAWPRPIVISGPSDGAGGVTLAVNARGDSVALWNTSGFFEAVVAATRRAGDASWAPPAVVSGDSEVVRGEGAAIDAAGDSVVVWTELRPDRWYGGVGSATLDAAVPRLATLRVPANGRVGKHLAFSASFRDISATSIQWRFGDGRSTKGPEVVHTYRRPGRYAVTVTATDAARRETSSTRSVRITR
jgi:PKD domain